MKFATASNSLSK